MRLLRCLGRLGFNEMIKRGSAFGLRNSNKWRRWVETIAAYWRTAAQVGLFFLLFLIIFLLFSLLSLLFFVYNVQKKEDQNVFFSNIFYKTQAIPKKFGTPFSE